MIRRLKVSNIAIIDHAELDLDPGLTALTGETGAGKSLFIDAIGLALGGRADADLVRAGTAKASIALSATLPKNSNLIAKCKAIGIDGLENGLEILREVSAEGRSSVKVNGKAVPVGTLREIGQDLIDLHGQHDHQTLLVPERQIEFLDSWIGPECLERRERVAEQYAKTEALKRKLHNLRTHQREREQRIDTLRYQIAEIEQADIKVGECHELKQRLSMLNNATKLSQATSQSLDELADSETSAILLIKQGVKDLESVQQWDDSLTTIITEVQTAQVQLEEAVRELRHYVSGLEFDESTIEVTAERLDLYQNLFRKYGEDEAAVVAYLEASTAELSDLLDDTMTEDGLIAQIENEESELQGMADSLTALRKSGATQFCKQVMSHIRDLAMESAEFEVSVEPQPIQAMGQDRVDFYFSANKGEPLRLLSRVASGGEISRVMLAIKVASAGRAGVPTLIFDEVDTGLSGRAAAITARKLSELSKHYQVIVISHLPQIAGAAAHHFRIEKSEVNDRVKTTLTKLTGEQRINELARLLAGEEIGESARANAAELLSLQSGGQSS